MLLILQTKSLVTDAPMANPLVSLSLLQRSVLRNHLNSCTLIWMDRCALKPSVVGLTLLVSLTITLVSLVPTTLSTSRTRSKRSLTSKRGLRLRLARRSRRSARIEGGNIRPTSSLSFFALMALSTIRLYRDLLSRMVVQNAGTVPSSRRLWLCYIKPVLVMVSGNSHLTLLFTSIIVNLYDVLTGVVLSRCGMALFQMSPTSVSLAVKPLSTCRRQSAKGNLTRRLSR